MAKKFVKKTEEGYTLDREGVIFVDRVSALSLRTRTQPKIITMLVLQNSDGDVLLYERRRQPFTDRWTLPYGKLHIDDASTLAAAKREAFEKLDVKNISLRHAGDCYIRIYDDQGILMSTLAHIFYGRCENIPPNDRLAWVQPYKLNSYTLAPAVEKIVARTFFHDPFFFEEFSEQMI